MQDLAPLAAPLEHDELADLLGGLVERSLRRRAQARMDGDGSAWWRQRIDNETGMLP